MSAIEFAKRNVGKRLLIPYNLLPGFVVGLSNPYAQVVGYLNDDLIVIEFEKESFHKYCWPLYEDVNLVISRNDFYNPAQPMVMAANYKLITEVKKVSLAERLQEMAKVVPPKAYPTTCGTCNSPARKSEQITLCSNKSCNSRAKLKKKLGIKYRKTNPIRCNHKVMGKTCNAVAVYVRRGNTNETFRFNCEEGHIFEVETNNLKENDVVLYTVGKHDHSDRIWNGQRWDIY